MTPETALQLIILPTLAFMGGKYASRTAEHELLAIALQESELEHRVQIGGPAHGYWQFEKGGGVAGVLTHKATKNLSAYICNELDHEASQEAVYKAIVDDSILACAFARLLLYSDPKPLPVTQAEGWAYYLRNWRPGKPHPSKWPANWKRAEAALHA